MTKTFFLWVGILSATIASAQISKDPGDFDKVKIYDRISAELIQSETNKVEITGTRSKDVIVSNQNGELKIAMPPAKLLKGEEISVKVYYKSLKSIDGSEGTFISTNGNIEAAKLEVTAKEGAEIKLMITAEILKVKSVTGAKIRLSGTADEQEISIGTGGSVFNRELQTRKTDVSINAGGEAEVSASDFVKARTKAGGDITVFGKPQTIDRKSMLGGTITVESE